MYRKIHKIYIYIIILIRASFCVINFWLSECRLNSAKLLPPYRRWSAPDLRPSLTNDSQLDVQRPLC